MAASMVLGLGLIVVVHGQRAHARQAVVEALRVILLVRAQKVLLAVRVGVPLMEAVAVICMDTSVKRLAEKAVDKKRKMVRSAGICVSVNVAPHRGQVPVSAPAQ